MRSMTGHGVGEAALGEARVVAELRSVNQRALELRTRASRELEGLAMFAELVVRERLRRGRVELSLRLEGASATSLDRARLASLAGELGETRRALGLEPSELPLAALLPLVTDLFSAASATREDTRAAVRLAVVRALEGLDALGRREGAHLVADLEARASRVGGHLETLRAAHERARDRHRERLRARLGELASDSRLDPARLELEVALLVERSDFAEELVRLESHLAELGRTLRGEHGEPAGRRLDFLLQELLREAATLTAKAQDAEASHVAVSIRVELERMREQVQNLE
jgi:uncharacterized protein (TIGR00255 family)